MATRPPPQTKAILATPLNVEESKAQRQQRSQARFRDRGGIFVPSNRNTLADILLGKAPPLTRPRKSVSASPSLRRQSKGRRSSPRKSNANILRRSESPVKQSRKSTNGGSREVVSNIESSTELNGAAASTKTHKGKKTTGPVARRSSTKGSKPAEADPLNEESDSHSNVNPEPLAKAGTKSKPSEKPVPNDAEPRPAEKKSKSKSKNALKGAGQNTLSEMENSTELKKAAGKRAPRASAQPKSTAIKATDLLSERQDPRSGLTASRTTITNAPAAASFSAEAGPSTSARPKRRKSGDLYSCGESEDEYVPKGSKKKKAPARTSSSGKSVPAEKPTGPRKSALPAIMEEDEDQEEATHSSSNLQRSMSIPTSKNKLDKSSSSALKSSSSKAKASTTGSSKSSRSKVPAAADPEPEMTTKKSKSGKGSSAKGKEVASQDNDTMEIAPQKAGLASSTKSNKRRADDIDSPEEEPEPPAKRPKCSGKAAQNAKITSGPKKTASNKRTRDEDDEVNDTVADAQDARPKKSTKLKKTVDDSDTDAPAPSKTKKGMTPAAAAKAKKKPAPKDSNGAKKAAKKSTKKTGQKENTSSEKASQPQVPVVKRGPPKSVLARIKASAQTHEVDNDPDEIDFLS